MQVNRPSQTIFNARKYKAKGDGVTNDTAAIQAAIDAASAAGGGTVYIPAGTFAFADTLTLYDNVHLGGSGVGSTTLSYTSESEGVAFDLTGLTNSSINNLTINGNNTAGSPPPDVDGFITMANATACVLRDLEIIEAPGTNLGSILLSGTATKNSVTDIIARDGNGSAIGLTGSSCQGNHIGNVHVTDYTGFGVRLGSGAHGNLVENVHTTSNGLELVATASGAYSNRIDSCHAQGCGDNGFSISGEGKYNQVVNCTAKYNDGAGCWVWASYSTVTGCTFVGNNQVPNNWPGVGISANYGGTGQNNIISGNVFDDDQATPTQHNNVRIAGNSYTQWASSQTIAAGDYRYYGLNVYQAITSGTSGATPPTHTTGDVTDDVVTWRYINSFSEAAVSINNTVGPNILGRFASGSTFDSDGFSRNKLIEGATGRKSAMFYANQMVVGSTSPAAAAVVEETTNDTTYAVMDFDGTAQENAYFTWFPPKNWDRKTVTYEYLWMSSAADTDGIVMNVRARAFGNGDVLDSAFGSPDATLDNAVGAANTLLRSAESDPITIGGTPQEGDAVIFHIYRSPAHAGDTHAEDVRVVGVKIFFNTLSDSEE